MVIFFNFYLHIVQTKLEIVVGVPAANMKLVLKDEHGKTVCELGDDSAMLGAYPAEDFMQLHVSRDC